jgi:eukaryotic-like serine/threonine-protein kinase
VSDEFGRFELLERIGVGGMAEVWKSRVGGIGGFEKILVVKKILPAFASNKTFIEMLLAEARLCAVLQHTNIVQTYENGEIGGQYYIAMEYVPGYDLFKVLSRATQVGRRIPVELCLFIAAEVAKGLAYAHSAKDTRGKPLNIIHRDVSPSNVLISEAGEVKVMDFGVARATMDDKQSDGQSRAGVLKGKLGYMSPEQVTGQPFDRRRDIFSLGIILYESITLKRLFLGRTDLETLVNIRDARIEHKFRKHNYIEESVRAILRMALARASDDRYDSALDLHDDISNLLFEWKIQVTNRSLAAFVAELFDDQDSPAAPQRRRKSALAPGAGEAESVAFSAEEVRRQAEQIKQRRVAERRASIQGTSDELSQTDVPIANRPTKWHERPSAVKVEAGQGVVVPTVSSSSSMRRALSDTSPGMPALLPDGNEQADPMRAALATTFANEHAPDFSLSSGEFTKPQKSDELAGAPTTLRDSKLRPVPLRAEPRARPTGAAPSGRNSEGARYLVRSGDNEVLGPVGRESVERMIETNAAGIGAEVGVDGGAFRPIEEITELRDLLATVVPEREAAEKSGVVSRLTFPPLLFELYTEKVTGCLQMRQDHLAKFIYLRRGRPQHIASNQKNETLGEFLKAQGLITQSDFDTALAQIERSGGRLGDALVGLNTIKPYQLYQILEKQFHAKLIDAFGWDDAKYVFYAGDAPPSDAVPLDLDPVAALAEGVRSKLTFALLDPYFEKNLDKPLYRARNSDLSVESLRFQARETKALHLLMSSNTLRQALNDKSRNRQQRLAMMQVGYLMLQTKLLTFEAVS